MAKLDIITIPDPRLKLVSEPVAHVDDRIRKILDDMLETMYDAPGIGLAAIQVGVAERLVTIDVSREGEPKAPLFLVNPEVVWTSEETNTYEEGCLSVPEHYDEVERPARCRVTHLDRDGVERTIEAEGLLATCLQHEIDHLNGVVFIDHLSRLKRERVVKKFSKLAKVRVRSVGWRPSMG
ncbi:MAG: peptide deformylase [Phyllobacteriaceae bacterium]|nr:peptide deformylase [Phyllobacteriaceae bacterium]